MIRRILAFASALLMALALSVSPVLAAGGSSEEVLITSAADLVKFAENCRLDSWSEGKTVELLADIDMAQTKYVPAPIFKGVFHGNGHSVSGLTLSAEGSVVGFFRYNDGEIYDLTIDIAYIASGSGKSIGAVAGLNRGYIEGCTVFGGLSGESTVGGIAGENTGEISDCYFGGVVQAKHACGGIAGLNSGSILECENAGRVNSELIEDASSNVEDLLSKASLSDPGSVISTDNLPVVTDVGGIAGISSGKLISCENRGTVGFAQTGYHIGGIVGRQIGSVMDCSNRGTVDGRCNVGGIVGLAEPFVRAESELNDSLRSELNGLYAAVDVLLEDAKDVSDDISGELQSALGSLEGVIDSGYEAADGLRVFIDRNTAELDEFAVRINTAEKLFDPAVKEFSRASRSLDLAMTELNTALDELIISDEITAADKQALKDAVRRISESNDRLNDTLDFMTWVFAADSNDRNNLKYRHSGPDKGYYILSENRPENWQESAYKDWYYSQEEADLLLVKDRSEFTTEDIYEIEDELMESLDTRSERLRALLSAGVDSSAVGGEILDSMTVITRVIERYYFTEDADGKTRVDRIGEALTEMSAQMEDATYYLSRGMKDMESLSGYLAGNEPLSFSGLGESYKSSLETLRDGLNGARNGLSSAETAVNEGSEQLLSDMQVVNGRFNGVMMVIADILDYLSNPLGEDKFIDESAALLKKGAVAKISQSENRGGVSGDRNVGGIVGGMSFETDLDGLDGSSGLAGSGLASTYHTHCIVSECVNYGMIEGRSGYCGGITGCEDTGLIASCSSYGDVSCPEGSYAGGIAGFSEAEIRGSYAKGNISARTYLGGVAGYGTTLAGCGSVVRLKDGSELIGAIAGDLAEDGSCTGCSFSNEDFGAIDGVSYAAYANPLSYEEMMALDDVPDDFVRFTLNFVAGGELVASLPFEYGDSLDQSLIPAVPQIEGYIGTWEPYDYSSLNFSDTVEAVYIPQIKVISSSETDPDSGRALVLAEASFGVKAKLLLLGSEYAAPQDADILYQHRISLEDALVERASVKIHTFVPDDGDYTVLVCRGGEWKPVDTKKSGSYLVFDAYGTTIDYCVVNGGGGRELYLYGSAGIVAAGAGAAALVRGRRKKNRKKKA